MPLLNAVCQWATFLALLSCHYHSTTVVAQILLGSDACQTDKEGNSPFVSFSPNKLPSIITDQHPDCKPPSALGQMSGIKPSQLCPSPPEKVPPEGGYKSLQDILCAPCAQKNPSDPLKPADALCAMKAGPNGQMMPICEPMMKDGTTPNPLAGVGPGSGVCVNLSQGVSEDQRGIQDTIVCCPNVQPAPGTATCIKCPDGIPASKGVCDFPPQMPSDMETMLKSETCAGMTKEQMAKQKLECALVYTNPKFTPDPATNPVLSPLPPQGTCPTLISDTVGAPITICCPAA